jgi:subtilisin family serine protease
MHDYVLTDDSSWNDFLGPEQRARLDPNIRLVASLIDLGDSEQIFRRTGLRVSSDGVLRHGVLPLFLDLVPGKKADTLAEITTQIQDVKGKLHLNDVAVKDVLDNPEASILEAGLVWHSSLVTLSLARSALPGDAFRITIAPLVKQGGLRRVKIPNCLQPCLQESLDDIGLPSNRKVKNVLLDGHDVVVGIIDDGCALAHRNFLVPGPVPKSRVHFLWDQAREAGTAAWSTQAPGASTQVPYGLEIDNAAINAALQAAVKKNGLLDEDAFYEGLQYEIGLASHGTHVMDIAAGNGASLIGTEGVAPASHLIFVQLPSPRVDEASPLLENFIHSGVRYIFQRAQDLAQQIGIPLPVVINISYGGYDGPHDGTSPTSKGIDDCLSGFVDRAVVVSAGNGFEADCHARGTVVPGSDPYSLQWNLSPEDPTANPLEIYYDENARLSMALRMPGRAHFFAPVHLGEAKVLKEDGKVMGWMENVSTGSGLPNIIRILLNSTVGETGSPVRAAAGPHTPPTLTAPCRSGSWVINLFNHRTKRAPFHAWIGRDDWRRGVVARHQQSRFAPSDADPTSTIVDLATGHLAVCVGAHNGDTAEICGYSAAGPTRDGRPKPDVTAPAEEDATCRGILCASSRRSQPSWFNGTSASAPVVAGMVALMFQYNRDSGGSPLSPSRVVELLKKGAVSGGLVGNKRQDVDPHRPHGKAQSDHFHDVAGDGKVDVPGSMP